jgi:hypothetical protein
VFDAEVTEWDGGTLLLVFISKGPNTAFHTPLLRPQMVVFVNLLPLEISINATRNSKLLSIGGSYEVDR